jgi:uncharacterized protein YbbC (DUF1343 family)
MKSFLFLHLLLLPFTFVGQITSITKGKSFNKSILVGADQPNAYLPLLRNKRVGVVANQTSTTAGMHLVDYLLAQDVEVKKVFAPEHGFRGDAGAGEHIADGKDGKTGLPLVSLYGKNEKPSADMLKDLDVILFDIQDVGARFYTYISTLHYVMEAAAENKKSVIVLDRPNPNGFYIDGPVLKKEFQSFVGMDAIPVVHGCTVGELAQMMNGEGWLKGSVICDLKVITCTNYSHSDYYELPIQPSPNLPNMSSVYLYPSLCFFEGTTVSVGRGTAYPFQCIGYPGNTTGTYTFTPLDKPGIAMNPPHEGVQCTGHLLSEFGSFYFQNNKGLYLEWLIGLYQASNSKATFFTNARFFDKLAGTDQLRLAIEAGKSKDEIIATWQADLTAFKTLRKKYLLYPDFE